MNARRKPSQHEITRRLIADADHPDAWEEPLTVARSRSPRPAWYGRARHLELAAKFHVLSVLHRLGAEANLTYAQPDNVDITAVRESGEAFTIDVKTVTGTTEWRVAPFRSRERHFLAFVCFAAESTDPRVVPEVYLWASADLMAFIAHRNAATISLEVVAQTLDPKSAWDQFTAQPAA